MLGFWYSERCTRQFKLITCIITVVIIYYCSTIEKLDSIFSGMALLLGVSIHLLRELRIKISAQTEVKPILSLLLYVLPAMALIILMALLPALEWMILTIQLLGFAALGFFVVSVYSHRTKRSG